MMQTSASTFAYSHSSTYRCVKEVDMSSDDQRQKIPIRTFQEGTGALPNSDDLDQSESIISNLPSPFYPPGTSLVVNKNFLTSTMTKPPHAKWKCLRSPSLYNPHRSCSVSSDHITLRA